MANSFYQNFEIAFNKLKQFCEQFDGSEIQQAGVIQAFEFTFEQCWKAIQKKAGDEGVTIASPKKAFEWAFQNNWILSHEEQTWIDILSDRNLTSHTYRQSMAQQVSLNVIKVYLSHFKMILDRMKK